MLDPLAPERLSRTCDPSAFPFETTEEIQADQRIIGQPRGTQAIDFGIHISSPGFNIFVLGESGTGRTTAIKRFIEKKAEKDPVPDDWVYVFNFSEPHKPNCISLPPGMGTTLRNHLETVLAQLQVEIPRAFENEAFRQAALEVQRKQKEARDALFEQLQARAASRGAGIASTPEGFQFIPLQNGQPLTPQAFAQLGPEQEQAWKETLLDLEDALNETMYQVRQQEVAGEAEIQELVRRVASTVVDMVLGATIAEYQEYGQVVEYLSAVHKDIIENIALFRDDNGEELPVPRELLLRRYRVNIFVDHARSTGAPVVVELNPTIPRLLGRVEHESRMGGITTTDFTLLRSGAVQEAIGGYLVIRAKDLFTEIGAYEALKRVLIGGEVKPDDPAARGGSATEWLDPQPIAADLKVILVGPSEAYYSLFEADEDFKTVFKVMADFDELMARDPSNEMEYAGFVASVCEEEGLLPFDRTALARIVEHGARLAESQNKLTTRFGAIADLIREADFWAQKEQRDQVTAADVLRAIEERIFRSNRIAARTRENMHEGKQLIDTFGTAIGQVNGLYVTRIGEYMFGQPSRITARTFVGTKGVVQIDREANLSGPIHNKGVLTLTGYVGGTYAADVPLALNAQITFEQVYSGVEGDSASSTELYALISSLAETPVRQAIAVTGSVNQMGMVQAIGGVTQKVEGWFELCRERGLTGEQGVLIPAANVNDLMLRPHVIDAVKEGRFHVWAVETIDQGLEILTGVAAGEVHQRAKQRLKALAEIVEGFEAL